MDAAVDMLERIPDHPLTYEEWLDLPETTRPTEVVDGVVVVSPAPEGLHQCAVESLAAILRAACPPGLWVAQSPRDWVLWQVPLLVRQPDLMVVTREQARAPRLTEPPLLAVEVVSPTSRERDFVTKPREYARAGLGHLWLVDPAVPEVVVRRLADGTWTDVARAERDALLEVTAPFPASLRPADLVA